MIIDVTRTTAYAEGTNNDDMATKHDHRSKAGKEVRWQGGLYKGNHGPLPSCFLARFSVI